MEKLYNKEEAAAFILNKFKEQGDFSFIDERLFCDMVRDIQELDSQYIDQCESEDAVYDDDEAYERIHGAMTEKYPDFNRKNRASGFSLPRKCLSEKEALKDRCAVRRAVQIYGRIYHQQSLGK